MSMQYKESLDSDTLINHEAESISIAAGEMSISTHKTGGNFIVGPLSITSPFTNIRFNSGMFKFNSLLLSTMPSTIITPIPVFEFDPPFKSISGLLAVKGMILKTMSRI